MKPSNFELLSINNRYFIFDINRLYAYKITHDLYNRIHENIHLKNDLFIESLLASLNLNGNSTDKQPEIKPTPILNLTLFVAQKCNMACIYCYGEDGEYGNAGFMSEKTAYDTIDWFINQTDGHHELTLTFFGGEPLLNFPLIEKSVAYSQKKAFEKKIKIKYSITTNGSLLNDRIIRFLNENNFAVVISFDGDKEIQDENRPMKNGESSFETIAPRVKSFLASRNGNALARATITNSNKSIEEIYNGLIEFGFQNANITIVTLPNSHEKNIYKNNIDAVLNYNIKIAYQIFEAIKQRNIKQFQAIKILIFIKQLRSKRRKYYPCGIARNMYGVSTDGSVYPCHRFTGNNEFLLGTLHNINEKRKLHITEQTVNANSICKNCWAKYFCGGGCMHDKYVANGDIVLPNESFCEELKLQVSLAIDIYSRLNNDDKDFIDSLLSNNKQIKEQPKINMYEE